VTALSTVLMAGLVATTILGELLGDPGPSPAELRLDIVAGALATLAVPALLRWPVPVAVLLSGLAAVSPAATPPATMGTLHVARTRPFGMAAAVACAGVAGHLVRILWRPLPGLSPGWYAVLVVAVHAALLGWGTWARARAALIASLAERARRAEAEQERRVAEARLLERTRIAGEMHDILAHRLSLLATYAGAVEYRPNAPPEQLAKAAEVVRAGAHQALEELREVIGVLQAEPDRDLSSSTRPQPTLADVPALIEESRRAGTVVEFDDRLRDPASVPSGVGRTAYRLVREGLTNARKHAAGQPVRITLTGRAGEALVIEISNRMPAGSVARPAAPGSGIGLIGLAERVHLAGGSLEHGVTAGGEFRLSARLPWAV
jgi:signal transduction histidine kinase